jgi:glucose-6-phosphate 1-dehydrogenase
VPDAYERLLYDVMRANSTLFMRADQVEAAWQWVDDIRDGWTTAKQKCMPYVAGTEGPTESIALIARDARQWKD